MDLVNPTTAALVVPYAQRLGTPFTLDAADAILMMDPPPPAIMAGSNARHRRYIDTTLSSHARINSSSLHSSTFPAWTIPARLNSTLNGIALCAAALIASIALGSVTSRVRILKRG